MSKMASLEIPWLVLHLGECTIPLTSSLSYPAMTPHHFSSTPPSVSLHSPYSASSTLALYPRFGTPPTVTLRPHPCGTSPTMILHYSHHSPFPSVTIHFLCGTLPSVTLCPYCGTQATMILLHPHFSTLASVVLHLIMVPSSQCPFTLTLAAILYDTSPHCVTSLR